jgi:DNA-binding NarL/FixJ family response regulator
MGRSRNDLAVAAFGEDVELGRRAYRAGSWAEAYAALRVADQGASLPAADIELLGRVAYMLGYDDDYIAALDRAHKLYVEAGSLPPAIRCAWWIGHNLLFRGELTRASGWFARGQRLLERVEGDCVEQGYLLIPLWLQQMGSGEWEAGLSTAVAAAEVGERFGDADLMWLARDDQARALVKLGRVDDALPLVDETLVMALGGDLSPIVTGIVYCNTIAFCQEAFMLRQAREWTEALTVWCDRQPEMVAHLGLCLVHRAEVMQQRGAWDQALREAERAAEGFTSGVLNQIACGQAHYRRGEVHRLRGEFDLAESAYRQASRFGYEPQPGLALLRLAQRAPEVAAASIRRTMAETTDPLDRARFLPAYVEIMLAVAEHDRAVGAAGELHDIAAHARSDALTALAAQASGAVLLTQGDASSAVPPLRRALRLWLELDATYDAARVRALIGLACQELGDGDGASLHFDAARDIFSQCGALPDLARLDGITNKNPAGTAGGLTARELEVLRLVAAGSTNREIASRLYLSEHTVARHLQNIFVKIGVSSRTAAGAYAFEHDLV